jgi:hypothetical protein
MGNQLARDGVDIGNTRDAYRQMQDLQSKYGELATDAGLAAGGALPPPFGTAADVASLGRSLWKGDWGGALFDVIGFVPILGDAAKAGKVANRLIDLKRAVDTAASGMQRAFQKTKDTAAKYWDDIAARNRQAYDDAIKNCTNKACRDAKATLKGPQYKNTPTDGPNGQWAGERGDSVWQPSNGGPPVTYKNGFPDYGPFSKGDVDIPMQGNRTTDFGAADEAMRQKLNDPNWERPANQTWHHNENGVTMQLIPKNVHATGGGASTPHMGGASLYTGGNATEF